MSCGNHCTCYYNQRNKANIFTCSGLHITKLPGNAPRYTNWIEVIKTNVTELCGTYPYLQPDAVNVTRLDLTGSKVGKICDGTLDSILHTSHLKWLNLAENNLTEISQTFSSKSNHLERLWLAGNPIHCGCNMIWMIDWIGNATAPSGGRLVQDYQDVICGPGLQAGTPVYKLNRVDMGCFPKHLPSSTIIILAAFGGFIIFGLAVLTLLHKNRVRVRWLMYKHFGTLIGADNEENLNDMEYDAFLSYRYLSANYFAKCATNLFRNMNAIQNSP